MLGANKSFGQHKHQEPADKLITMQLQDLLLIIPIAYVSEPIKLDPVKFVGIHLLESCSDIRIVREMFGHNDVKTKMI
jgi:hypothetical protein